MKTMRARLLAAMSLGSLAACPRQQEPTVATGGTPAVSASGQPSAVPPVSTIDPPADASIAATEVSTPVPVIDAAPEIMEAATEVGPTDAKPDVPKPKPSGPPPLPKDAWSVQYPVTVPGQPWCKTWWANCVPLAWAVAQTSGSKPGVCPASIPVTCRPTPGVGWGKLGELGDPICHDDLQLGVTNAQRAAGKKDACCYAPEPHCMHPGVGRLLHSEGRSIHAGTAERNDWLDRALLSGALETLDEATRAEVARHYQAMALGEHAAIASFSATALSLMAHDAPPDLVAATHEAALDEIAHAKVAFSLASAFSRRKLGPGRLPIPQLVESTLAELAVATLRDACIPETVGAMIAREAAAGAIDPVLRQALTRIAEDEARHAELAFRTLAWLVRKGGNEVKRAVAAAFSRAVPPAPSYVAPASAFGVIGTSEQRALIVGAFEEIVAPCVQALLDRAPAFACA